MIYLLLLLQTGFASDVREHFLCLDRENFSKEFSPGLKEKEQEVWSLIVEQRNAYGKCLGAEQSKESFFLLLEGAKIPFKLKMERGKVSDIGFGPPIFANDSIKNIEKRLGRGVHIWVSDDKNQPSIDIKGSVKASVGESVFIILLDEYRKAILEKKVSPETIVKTSEENSVFSLGYLGYWPVQIPLTLESLTVFMKNHRDPIAADMLASVLFSSVAFYRPYSDMVRLLHLPEGKARKKIEENKLVDINEINLEKVRDPFLHRPSFVDSVGWFFSGEELCQAALSLQKRGEFGLDQERQWSGEFPVTLNITKISKKRGSWRCVSVTEPKGLGLPGGDTFERMQEAVDRFLAL